MISLDLGCGARKTAGAIGVDCCRLPGVDVITDLTRIPYPFAKDSVDLVHLNHVLEHMDSPVNVLAEVWRVCKTGAEVHIRVPHYTGSFAWRDPTHKRCFTSHSFSYFGENSYSYYTKARFKVRLVRLKYFLEPPYRRIYRLGGALVQWVLDHHPTFAEKYLAYLVGGIDELQVVLEVEK